MEKLEPHYPLATIKPAFAEASSLNRSLSRSKGSTICGWMMLPVVAVIQGLSNTDFEK